MVFIYTTCENIDEAKVLSELIINKRIGACVDFWPITSCYKWEESFKCVSHFMLLVTTFEAKIEEINQIISENHTYGTPLIAGVDVRRINHPYKKWMTEAISL